MPDDEVPGLTAVVERLAGGYTTIGEMAYAVLREAIVSGALRPGQKLRQEALAEAMSISRIPVRSALMQLEAEGLVTFTPHRGSAVRELTEDYVRETYDVRTVLEVRALEKSMRRMTRERSARLLDLAERLDAATSPDTFIQDRVAFYHELYDVEHNPVLVGLIDQLRSNVGRDLLGLRVGHQHGHEELARMAARGDVRAARAALRSHLSEVCQALLLMLQETGQPPSAANGSAS